MDLNGTLTRFGDYLTENGLPASVEADAVNTPGAWIQLALIAHDRLDGSGTARVHLYLIAADTGTGQALIPLTELLTIALALVAPTADTTATSVVLPNDTTPLPALRITTDIPTQ